MKTLNLQLHFLLPLVADALRRALTMPPTEQRERIEARVQRHGPQ